MRHAVFVVPYVFATSVRFLRAALGLPGVAVSLVSQDGLDRFEPDIVSRLAGHAQVADALDPRQLAAATRDLGHRIGPVDRLVGVLEQLQVPLAQAREALGLPGANAETANNFRDKAQMKDVLRAAGVPCARHRLAHDARTALAFVEEIGGPVVVKPPAGAGAVGTFRIEGPEQARATLAALAPRSDDPLLLEEFVVGEEHSFDAIVLNGDVLWHSISRYRPTPLEVVRNEWIQWCVLLPRHIDGPEYDAIREVGPAALAALGLDTGLAHMEWFRREDGSVAVSEVGARPPGAQFTSLMSWAHDTDMYAAWSRLVIEDAFEPPERRYAAGAAYFRGQGSGRVAAVHGLDRAQREFGDLVVEVSLPERGAAESTSYEGEGYAILRHPDTDVVASALGKLVEMIQVEFATVNVLLLAPSFPSEMVLFTEGLAAVGARVFGVGEHPEAALPERCRRALTAYLQIGSLFDEDDVVKSVLAEAAQRRVTFDRVECLWEPLMILTARLREGLGAPGMTVAQTVPFRDKEAMKQVLDDAGLRTPRHARCSDADAMRAAAERIGYPLIVKPIAGAGSADTHRVDDAAGLENVIALTGHVPEVSVEEYIEGEEYTFDTICAGGDPLHVNMSLYRPRPLLQRQLPWVSPQTVALRDLHAPELAAGRKLGFGVLKALGFGSGFTHMEWFLTPDGEAVFGEIGARPPGARSVDIMNYACDVDLFRGWAEAVCFGRFDQPVERRYNAAIIFKRAQGEGRITAITGLESLLGRFGSHIVHVELLPVGAHRRNWKQTLLSDGHIIVRHPDLQACLDLADAVGTDLQMYAS